MSSAMQAPVVGVPDHDPKADRGDAVPAAEAKTVELTADELKLIGKGDEAAKEPAKEEAKEEAKKDETPKEEAKKEEAKEPAKEEAKKEEKPRGDDGKFIPKARFDEVNNRAKAKVAELEQKLDQMAKRLAPLEGEKAPDVKALETSLAAKTAEYTKLVADGELDKANSTMMEISKINRQIVSVETHAVTAAHSSETQNVAALGDLVTMFLEAYPVFDAAKPDVFKQEYVDWVATKQGQFEATGSSAAEALREAVELAVLRFKLDPVEAAVADPAKPAEKAEDKGEKRKESAVDRALAAAAAQPASTAAVGADSDKAGVSKITVDQILDYPTFEALAKNESTLKRLRGDLV